jgi:hypothetical protein
MIPIEIIATARAAVQTLVFDFIAARAQIFPGLTQSASILVRLRHRERGKYIVDCSKGLFWPEQAFAGLCIMGLTLDELAGLARAKTRRTVTVLQDMSAEGFREHLKRSNDPAHRYVINFDRKMIFGAGAGHHSPIGGYLENEDLVFVLDVSRDYRPWLVERTRLFDAMNTWDGDKKRGMLLIN